MSIKDRLRPSSSIIQPSTLATEDATSKHDVRPVTGVVLSCDDMSNDGDVHREYILTRDVHRTIDFVRASVVHPTGRISVAAGGAARATFSSPVMSRRHARISFVEDGSVSVMDVGSMHGTYLESPEFHDFFPERLKPRRQYTLRSGDTLLLGKSVNRESRDWKPVALRVTFVHDGSARPATPAPNRYGMYTDSAGLSDVDLEADDDEDVESLSSSSGEDEDSGSREQSVSSPDSSPIVSHSPLQMEKTGSEIMSFESMANGSRDVDVSNPATGVFDLNRTMSARNALRSILPPLPTIQLPAIRRLPSLRELGFFGGVVTGVVNENAEVDAAPVTINSPNEAESDLTISIPMPMSPLNLRHDGAPSTNAIFSSATDEEASGSMFPWQEPSHPQNQLGLELSEHGSFNHEQGNSEVQQEDEGFGYDNSESSSSSEGNGESEVRQDDEKSMEISPCSSRDASPSLSFQARAVFDTEADVDELDEGNYEEGQHECQCHEQVSEGESRDTSVEDGVSMEYISYPELGQAFEQASEPAPATPLPRQPILEILEYSYGAPVNEEVEYGYARTERSSLYNPIPPSPVSISRRGKRVGSRFGPPRKTPSPVTVNSALLRCYSPEKTSSFGNDSPDTAPLRARVESLESRIQKLREITESAAASASSASASASPSFASVEETRKEMESMREEMRRLSSLMEILMAKMDARAAEPERVGRGVQVEVETPQGYDKALLTRDRSSSPSVMSRKRKRDDDSCTLGARDLEAERLLMGLNAQLERGSVDSIPEFRQPDEQPEVRPAKRARTGTEKAAMTFAAAAGYTGLGAALAWATLAYVL